MPDERLLRYITGLTKEAMECLYSWREAEQARLSSGGVRGEDLYRFSDSLINHPLQSLINKLNSDHKSILNGEAIRPPDLKEFMPNHYSISFPVTSPAFLPVPDQGFSSWSYATAEARPEPNIYNEILGIDQALQQALLNKAMIDMATNPDQSGYGKMEVDKDGNKTFTPITKEEFYKKTAVEVESDNFQRNVNFMKKNEADKRKYERECAEQKIKDGIIERGGE